MIELHILINDNGTVQVGSSDPKIIDNLPVCYGILELAKDELRQHHFQKQLKVKPAAPGELKEFGKRQ